MVELGTWVISTEFQMEPDGLIYCTPGDVGHVIEIREGHYPTVAWERTGMVCDADPSEFDILCGPGFARDQLSTPGYGGKK